MTFPAPQIGQTSRTPHTAKQTASCSASFTSRCQLTSEERTETTTNKELFLPFHACICSHLSSPWALFWPNVFRRRHPANLCLSAVPRHQGYARYRVRLLIRRGPWCSNHICSDLNSFFVSFDGTPSQPDWHWLDAAQTRREPRSTHTCSASHYKDCTHTRRRHTNTLLSRAMFPL